MCTNTIISYRVLHWQYVSTIAIRVRLSKQETQGMLCWDRVSITVYEVQCMSCSVWIKGGTCVHKKFNQSSLDVSNCQIRVETEIIYLPESNLYKLILMISSLKSQSLKRARHSVTLLVIKYEYCWELCHNLNNKHAERIISQSPVFYNLVQSLPCALVHSTFTDAPTLKWLWGIWALNQCLRHRIAESIFQPSTGSRG